MTAVNETLTMVKVAPRAEGQSSSVVVVVVVLVM